MTARNLNLEVEIENLNKKLNQLTNERDLYQKLFEGCGVAISIIDLKTNRFIKWNDATIIMHGARSRDNLTTLSHADLSPQYQPCGKRSDEILDKYIAKTIEDGPQLFRWTYSRFDGSTFPCLLSLTALSLDDSNLMLAIVIEITGNISAQKLNVDTVKTVGYEQEDLDSPVITINLIKDGSFDLERDAFRNMTNFSLEEYYITNFWQISYKKYDWQKLQKSNLLKNREYYCSHRKKYFNESSVILSELFSGIKIMDGKSEISLRPVATDQFGINAIEKQIEDANNAAESKSDFLANINHEMCTPLNAVIGGLQLLKSVKLDSNLKQVLDNASVSAQYLLTIINDILDYTELGSNQLKLELVKFSLSEILESIKFELEPIASTKKIKLLFIKEASFQNYWFGDVIRVKQIIFNLVSNAVKFTYFGTVKINVGTQNQAETPCLFIEVTDSGIGMSEGELSKIFEIFSQVDNSKTRKHGGIGLGLSITLHLIKAMEGSIEITSKENKGTKVNVILPLEEAEKVKLSKIHKLSVPNLMNKKILIAEDNAINKVIIHSMLKATRASLTIVENGKLALDSIEKDNFDLVLMDIQMPVMDGIEAQRHINQIKPKIPVIALTANALKRDVERYLALGFASHISKPIDINELYSTLTQFE